MADKMTELFEQQSFDVKIGASKLALLLDKRGTHSYTEYLGNGWILTLDRKEDADEESRCSTGK